MGEIFDLPPTKLYFLSIKKEKLKNDTFYLSIQTVDYTFTINYV